ncbi:hypothetical protein KR032_001319 [Drosophila birchii]|nr:hypothetical protein KR032_001319 [Drosophila birchii]
MSAMKDIPVNIPKLLSLFKTVIPKPTTNKYKGQSGRIGVIGGSLEYTGAPYFAAITSLKIGADLAHVFCHSNASTAIKAYSPDLIVHPVLDCADAVDKILPWLERLHIIVFGPGLGREQKIIETATKLLKLCLNARKPIIIDADGLFILNDNIDLIYGHSNIILTPNAIEFQRLFGEDVNVTRQKILLLRDGIVILKKGLNDKIYVPQNDEIHIMPSGGSGRRCGGQGDLLSGSLATFFYWSLQSNQTNPAYLAACASSYFIKQLNYATFQKFGRSTVASDMINEIYSVFRSDFES